MFIRQNKKSLEFLLSFRESFSAATFAYLCIYFGHVIKINCTFKYAEKAEKELPDHSLFHRLCLKCSEENFIAVSKYLI